MNVLAKHCKTREFFHCQCALGQCALEQIQVELHTIGVLWTVRGMLEFYLVRHFKHSCSATEALSNKQLQLNPSKQAVRVIQDVATHRNSSHYVLRHLDLIHCTRVALD